ncbi:MAG: hypothetical protein ACKOWF_01290 [Chloroflexota bacterium]
MNDELQNQVQDQPSIGRRAVVRLGSASALAGLLGFTSLRAASASEGSADSVDSVDSVDSADTTDDGGSTPLSKGGRGRGAASTGKGKIVAKGKAGGRG